jgi:YD repeat-containing protein
LPGRAGAEASAADGGGTNLYTYDALDNLIGVRVVGQLNNNCTSGGIGQMRCFAYSSLSRRGSATNPESGTTNYVYDNNGNMTSRTDAVLNVTTVSYDAMNRPQGASGAPAVVYTTTGSTQPTAAICYVWDLDFKGALRSVSTSSSNTSCATAVTSDSYTHDQLGRIDSSEQFTLGQWYQFRYGYSLEDRLNYEKYPSGRQVKYTLDTARRVNAVQNGTTLANYASGIGYVAAGGLNGLTLGNGVTHSWSWNDRFQPVGMTAKNA